MSIRESLTDADIARLRADESASPYARAWAERAARERGENE